MADKCIKDKYKGEKIKIFLLGVHDQNAGPSNVNKSLIKQAGKELVYIHSTNRYIRNIEIIWKILFSNQVIISGTCAPRFYKILEIFHKNYSYLMHGCIKYENKINKLNVTAKTLMVEDKILENSNHIICVSEGYSQWVKQRYPAYQNRITFVNNGIELKQRAKVIKEPYTVAVSGGNRCIKNNLEVYKAVETLNQEGIPCRLYIFGRKYPYNDNIPENNFSIYCGHLNKKEYYQRLDKISCFVLNSEVESFGLVVADALNCNCSLLMSKNVGAQCIMHTMDKDIIQNPHDVKEVAAKIKAVFRKPNVSRLFNSIDLKECSEAVAYQKLKKIIEE